ncbi:MAG TPA: hypothetical protein DGZ24_01290 [Rhodospirillaceae bacterium]|nr:hypothetical protein [Candidatus Neomarinimicrobiota bacterium]HCX13932.1 hypothetical protein [Rhodospirillaceae bacterium]
MVGVSESRQSRATLQAVAATLVLCLLAACSATTHIAYDPRNGDGLGGTGITHAQNSSENGDGIGGTGVVGTISGFGSIIVNGLQLEFDPKTIVETDGKPTSLEALKIGQVIRAVADHKDGELHLNAIDIRHAVTGPVEAIDHDSQTMMVLGQKVHLNLGSDGPAINAFKNISVGNIVSVSGLRWADGTIIATRVDEQSKDERLMVRGTATVVSSDTVQVGGLTIPLKGTVVSSPKAGAQVFASGRMLNGQFVPDVVMGEAPLPFDEDINSVSLEAYSPVAEGGDGPVSISGITVEDANLPSGTKLNDRIVITGRIASPNRIVATGIEKVRTVVTIQAVRGAMRPSVIRPDVSRRTERMVTPDLPPRGRPQSLRPEIPKPTNRPLRPKIEKPQTVLPPMA